MAQTDIEDDTTHAVTCAEHAEVVELRRELRVAKMKNEILKRAAAYFARETCSQGDLHLHPRRVR